ncbi:MAG: IS110 family transposase [Deltaproteobacteria bacterium]|nr:IS110 family transposase [Deltaproteobacteria bacterium]
MKDYYLGCDVSKGYCDFVILDRAKKIVLKNFQLDDTYTGHQQLKEILADFINNRKGCNIYAAVESTGGYENNWYKMLCDLQLTLSIFTARLNPLGVNHSSKAELRRNKTDKSSAYNVAEYLISYPEVVRYNKERYFESLRRQWKFVKMLKKHKVGLMGQLESLVYVANPDIMAYWKEKMPEWVLNILSKYPTAKELSRARIDSMVKIPYLSRVKAEVLITAAKRSVASSVDKDMASLIKSLAVEIKALTNSIKTQSLYMENSCNLPEVELLTSFPGIGKTSAIGLMLEIGTIDRFSSSKALAAFVGVHPVYKESGDGIGGIRMSKQGRKEARWTLFLIARSAIVHNPYIRTLYEEYQNKGKCKMSSIGIIMHKILRIIYGMLKTNTEYDPNIDCNNRTNMQNKEPENIKNNDSRRYQNLDDKAPVSRRQRRKRKEQETSQNGIAIESGIINPVHKKDIIERENIPIY